MAAFPTVEITTKPCIVCGKTSKVKVGVNAARAWRNGMHVQDAFPAMSADRRELLISGTHPKCWDQAFGSEEE